MTQALSLWNKASTKQKIILVTLKDMIRSELLKLIRNAVQENRDYLDLSSQGLTSLPPQIGQLTNLKEINLSSNKLSKLPEEMGRLTKLTKIDLSNNRFTNWPAPILSLIELSSIDISFNQLLIIPKEVNKIVNLTELNLRSNQLTSLPKEINNLIYLTTFNLRSNQLISLPKEINTLSNLTKLDLRFNQLSILPLEIGSFRKLTELYVSFNHLMILPSEIGFLISLTKLDISHNKLINLPPEICNLKNLTYLNISYNQLAVLPPEIGLLKNLTVFELNSNKLTTLPPEITQLTNLIIFNLNSNKLTGLPLDFFRLRRLKKLEIFDNKLTELPKEIGDMSKLTILNLGYNRIKNLPNEIGKLRDLTEFYIYNNQLVDLPREIGQLSKLITLDLDTNCLTILPSEIGNLDTLEILNISYNCLTSLPLEIGKLVNLTFLDISFNSLTDLPPEIRNKHWMGIFNFLRQQLEQDVDYLYEAKFLIIGEPGAGKTTLAQKIKNPSYILKNDEESTEGIDVICFSFPLDNGKKFQINIWDFGGQEIYHQTHQFFLTSRSLYTLVADSRKEDTDFYYWLNIVELLSNNSPLLIIKNEKQDRQRDINEKKLRGEFTNLKEIIATNLATNRGLETILKQVKHYIQSLPHVGDQLPAYWVKVREILEKDSRNYISLDEFITVCKYQGFKSLEDILVLSGYLHDLGIFLHFQKDDLLQKTIVLKPTWGTDAVYRVLDTPKVRNNLGKFSRLDLENIWQEEQYAPMRSELLRLMMKFKLCYEIPSSPNHYIAPQLLSADRADYDWDDQDNLLLRCEYEFMPKGILTRFIVEMHRWIENENLVWKTGVVLKKEDARAEIVELYRYHKGEIQIRVMGKRKRDLLTTVRHELGKIHDSYERLKYKTLVPCNCSECKDNQSPYFYDWDTINRYLDKNKKTIECQISCKDVNILRLVNDTTLSQSPFSLNNEDNPMSKNFNAQNMQYIENNYSEVNWNKYSSDSDVKQSVDKILEMLKQLAQKYPNITETEAENIVNVEFTTLQTQNPKQWQNITQNLLNKERWLQGGKAALIATTDHYLDKSVIYKAGLAFLDKFSEQP